MESPSDLVVHRAFENKVHLGFHFPYMIYWADPLRSINVVIRLYPKSMGSNSELLERDTEIMLPVVECVLGFDNELAFYFQEVLSVRGHLWVQPSRRIDPGNLDKPPVNILPDNLI